MKSYLTKSSAEKVSGSTYILLIHFDKACSIIVGKLGLVYFKKGYYLYVGSARKYIRTRLIRHLTRTKNKFWHIDYILSEPHPTFIVDIMISPSPCECLISKELYQNGHCKFLKKGFGSSDCNCISHFFRIQEEDYIKSVTKMLIKKGFSSIKNWK